MLSKRLLCLVGLLALSPVGSGQLDANFLVSTLHGPVPLTVFFADATTGGTPFFWAWKFGDGASSSVKNPAHIYTVPGTYSVSLTVTAFPGGMQDTKLKTDLITVEPLPLVTSSLVWERFDSDLVKTPHRFVVDHFNDDPWLDVALVAADGVFASAPARLEIHLGLGDGRLRPPWVRNTELGSSPTCNGIALEAGDLDNDGFTDLVLGNTNDMGFRFVTLLGDGSGTYPTIDGQAGWGGSYDDFALGDNDHDGVLDLTTTNLDLSFYAERYFGLGDGSFDNGPFENLNFGVCPREIALGDLTGDGRLETAIASGSGLGWFGVIDFPVSNLTPKYINGLPHRDVVCADLDGDGIQDIASSLPLFDVVSIHLSLGGGTFMPQQRVDMKGSPETLAIADLDLDGDLDVIVANRLGGTLGLLYNRGDGVIDMIELLAVNEVVGGPQLVDVQAGDLDLDGDPELLVARDGTTDSLTVLINPAH